MKTISLSQDHVTTVSDEDYAELSKHKWYVSKGHTGNLYAVRHAPTPSKAIIYMHRQILGLERGDNHQGDHKNHNTLDNRRDNLRVATRGQNQHNRKLQQGGSSRYKGVCLRKSTGRWQALIRVDGKQKHLGYFPNEQVAALAYDLAAIELHSEFAYLNCF